MAGQVRTLIISPNGTSRTQGVPTLGNFYSSQDVLSFSLPPQDLRIRSMTLQAHVGVYTTDGTGAPVLQHMCGLDFNPNVGIYGAFQQITMTRASPTVVDTNINPTLTALMISQTNHGNTDMLSHEAGSYVMPNQPFYTTTSNGPYNYIKADGSAGNYENFKLVHTYSTPLLSMLTAGQSVDLSLMEGLNLFLTIGDLRSILVATFANKVPSTNVAADIVNPWVSDGAFYNKSFDSYNFCMVNPTLVVQVDIASRNPSIASFQVTSVNFTRTQAYPGNNQTTGYLLPRQYLQKITFALQNRNRVLQQHYGPATTCGWNIKDQQLTMNDRVQKFSYPTAKRNYMQDLSEVIPNAFLNAAIDNYDKVTTYQKIFGGQFLNWPYDDGTGMLLDGVVLTSKIMTGDAPKGSFPFNDIAVGASPFLGSSYYIYQQLNICPASVTENSSIRRERDDQAYDQNYLLSKVWQFYGMEEAKDTLDIVQISKNTQTIVLKGDGVAQVAAARNSISVPRELDFNTAARRSTVNRVVTRRWPSMVQSNPPLNTQMVQCLLPDSGLNGATYARLAMRVKNAITEGSYTNYTYALVNCEQVVATKNSLALVAMPTPAFIAGGHFAAGQMTVIINNPGPANYWTISATQQSAQPTAKLASTVPRYRGNRHYNARGYAVNMGGCSIVRSLTWRLPSGVEIQLNDLQQEAFLHRHGLPFNDSIRQTEFDSHLLNGYVNHPTSVGQLTPILANAATGTAFDCWNSATPFYTNNEEFTDYQLAAYPWPLTIDISALHATSQKMVGVPFDTKERRELIIGVDTRMIALSDTGCGYRMGFTTSSSYNQDYNQSASAGGQWPKLTAADTWELHPNHAPYFVISQVYHDPATQARIVESFMADGVSLRVSAFDVQSRYRFTLNTTTYDTITPDFKVQIGGRNPRVIKVLNQNLTNYTGDQLLELDNANHYPLPYYVASLYGAFGYSFPNGINPRKDVYEANQLNTLEVSLDDELLQPFNFGTSTINASEYVIAYGRTLARTSQELIYRAPRRRAYLEDYVQAPQDPYNAPIVAPGQTGAKTNYLCNMRGAPGLPYAFVSMMTIPDDFQNASIFQAHNTSGIRYNMLGIPQDDYDTTDGPMILHHVTTQSRSYCFAYTYEVTFSGSSASITYDFPVANDVK